MAIKRKRRYQETTFTGVVNNPPKFRPAGQRLAERAAVGRTKRRSGDLTEDEAWRFFDDGLKDVIRSQILGARLDERSIHDVRQKLVSSTRILRNVYSNAAKIHDLNAKAVTDKLRYKNTVKHQQEYIEDHFEEIANKPDSFPKVRPQPKKDIPGAPAGKQQRTATAPSSDLRTVTTTFSSIIRSQGITNNMAQHFREIFNAATEDVSNHIIDFSVQVLRYITMFKTHTFVIRNDQVQFVPTVAPFTLAEILPETIFDEATLERPLPPPLDQGFLNNAPLLEQARNFLNDQHLDRIFTAYFGRTPALQVLQRYPLHLAVLQTLPPPAEAPPIAFSHAKIVARNKFKTNFENLWNLKGRFTKVFNKLITTLLRFHLAPEREAKYQEYLTSRTQDQGSSTPTPAQAPHGEITFAGKTTNEIRRIFHHERRNQQNYTDKAKTEGARWVQKAQRSAHRLATFTAVRLAEKQQATTVRSTATTTGENTEAELEFLSQTNPAASTQVDDFQDSQQEENGDLSARAIRVLVAAMRNVIFTLHGQAGQVTRAQFRRIAGNTINGNTLEVCLNIVNRLMPYIPSRQNWFSKLHQIPFILLANEVFRATGHAGFAVKLTNLPSTSSLLALELDGPSLYNTFSVQQGDRRVLNLFTYDGRIITEDVTARSNDDAIFHSFFDLEKINNILAPYQLQFRHQITLLPGLKTVRLLGSKRDNATVAHAALPFVEKKATAPSKPPPAREQPTDAEKREIERLIALRTAEVEALARRLKQTMRERAAFLTNEYPYVKKLKATFPNQHPQQQQQAQQQQTQQQQQQAQQTQDFPLTFRATRNEMYQRIRQLKLRRDEFNQQAAAIKHNLAIQRSTLHRLRKGLRIDPPETREAPPTPNIQITQDRYQCYEKAENVRLHPALHNSQNMRFSGTDNGIVTMTETVRFDMPRFRFHLQLANTFEALKDLDETEAATRYTEDMKHILEELKANPDLLRVPKAHKMYATDIDFRTGAKKQRARLYREKHSPQGLPVVQAEAILSQNSLHDAQNLDEINARYQAQLGERNTIRHFYYTPAKARQQRQYEYCNRKQIDRLCSEERKYVKSDDGNYNRERDRHHQTIHFIGDRGTGVGSRIKGHLRYGGHWKSRKHSLNTSVCITNEHNSSQACAFCFDKVTHPVKMVKGELKTINGTAVCSNPRCLLVINKRSHQPRDSQSSLLIGLAGLCTVLSARTTFPALDPKNQDISQSNTDFQNFAGSFL